MSTNFKIDNMWCIYIMDYYLARIRNEMLIFATRWMKLGKVFLS